MSTEALVIIIGINVACAAFTYWRGVVTGTPRWLAFYTAFLIGPLALLILLSGSPSSATRRTPADGA